MDKRTCLCGVELVGHRGRKYCSEACKWVSAGKAPCASSGGPTGWRANDVRGVGAMCQPCRRVVFEHGTRKGYKQMKCRCVECRGWANETAKAYNRMVLERDGVSLRVKYRKTTDVHCSECGKRLRSGGGGAPKGVVPKCLDCGRRKRSRWGTPISRSVRVSIYERDAWTCQLCREPVEPDAHPLSDWFPTVDHIVLYSKGGPDTAENLRTAHRWCNTVRGADDRHSDLFEEAT